MRRKFMSFLLAGVLSFGLAAGAGAANVGDFTDVKSSDWYYSAVNHVTRLNYFSGTSATTFSPNVGMSRGMVVTVLARRFAGSLDAYTGKTKFTDVPADAYYAKAVNWATSLGVTNGTSNTTFSPNTPVTREQVATFLYRAAYPESTSADGYQYYLKNYSDRDLISSWAKPFLGWASTFSIIRGMDGKLVPQGTTTRAMFAQMLQNYDAYSGISIEEPTPTPTPDPVEPTPTPETGKWKKAYLDIVRQGIQKNPELKEESGYYFLYLDNDEIPELLIDYQYTYAGQELCMWDGTKANTQHRGSFDAILYYEKGSYLRINGGRMGAYYDEIYIISNGTLVKQHTGNYGSIYYAWEDTFTYRWDDKDVSKNEYNAAVAAVFDESRAKLSVDQPQYTYEEICKILS